MGKAKKFKANPFNLFLIDLKKTKRYFVSNQQAQEEWSKLSAEKMDYYTQKAKEEKERMKIVPDPQLSTDVLFEPKKNDEFFFEAALTEGDKNADVKELVMNAYDSGVLDDKIFYIVSIQSLYEDADDIFPCELAMVKLSLKRGVFGELHIRIDPGKLPSGSAWTALNRSNMTHKYLSSHKYLSDESVDDNYLSILMKILKFQSEDENLPMVFSVGDEQDDFETLHNTQRAMRKIFEEAGELDVSTDYTVYSVTQLLFYLKECAVRSKHEFNEGGTPFNSLQEANDFFTECNSKYLFTAKGCRFHEENDVLQHCCLSKVRRYGYIVAELLNA